MALGKGKFKIGTVGPPKKGTSKKTGRPYTIYALQFDDDSQWYDTFWTRDEPPGEGQELEGEKKYDEKFNSYKFEMNMGRGGSSWNPNAANANVFVAASAIVSGFLQLKKSHIDAWEKQRKDGQTAIEQYIDSVVNVAGQLKGEVVKMGGQQAEINKTSDQTTGAVTASDGDPGPMEPPADMNIDEEPVDLGEM